MLLRATIHIADPETVTNHPYLGARFFAVDALVTDAALPSASVPADSSTTASPPAGFESVTVTLPPRRGAWPA
eukprot:3986330-Prymnesium_polylepis.1